MATRGITMELFAMAGVQWIQTGGGIWHEENYKKKPDETDDIWSLSIYQLWFLLPPELEESEVEYQNVQPENLPKVNNVKIIAGTYESITSPLRTPYNLTYLRCVQLNAGETFNFQTPSKQTNGFIFPTKGLAKIFGDEIPLRNLSVLERNEGFIEIIAQEDSKFVLITTEPFDYPIVPYGGSIHTNHEALRRSLERIQKIRKFHL